MEWGADMDTSGYEYFSFTNTTAINIASGAASRSFPPHRHSYGEMIVAGRTSPNIYKVNDTLYSLTEGDIILIWPAEQHEIVDASREDSIIIQYSNTFADSLFDMRRIINRYRGLHIICINSHRRLATSLGKIAARMKDIWDEDRKDRELRCAALLCEFMLMLDENHDEIAPDISNDGGKTVSEETLMRIMRVTDYIRNNLTSDNLSQAEMAAMAGVSRDYFSRVFSEVTGENYSKWINMMRVEKAVSLLSEEGLSLTQIAMLSGFKSIPSFNRVFAEYKGIPPSRYRRIMREETER